VPEDQRDPSLRQSGDGAVAVVRRAPFSDNPEVGARGRRTQQRILDAALSAFAEDGYHGSSIDRITKLARCSRVTFYQYFASKEDVFDQLAAQVARQASAATEALDPLTPALDGWTSLRTWLARFAEIHERYEPVFHALESDENLAAAAGRTGTQTIARIHARLETTTLPPRRLDPVIRMLLDLLNHTLDVVSTLRAVTPDAYPNERVEDALTDLLHRTLFGLQPAVNVHEPEGAPPPPLEFTPENRTLLLGDDALGLDASDNSAFTAVLDTGRDVFIRLGFHNTRVDDLVAAAGVSHGAFYRYFRNKEQLARMLTTRAMRLVASTLEEIPDVSTLDGPAGTNALRRWLRRYHAAHASETAMLHVWLEAALQDPGLRAESAPPLDWGRRRMARYLSPRGFGDVDMDAVFMVALLGVFGARQRRPAEIEAAAHIIERGLLGR
jgi:AcrR family transcriptional regulator